MDVEELERLKTRFTRMVPGLEGVGCEERFGKLGLLPAEETVRLRLENGGSPCAGRVEIHDRGQWRTVDHVLWDLRDAAVVCRELDCGTAISAPGGAHFGKGSGPIVTRHVECRGTEHALKDCQSVSWDPHNYSHDNDAGVICSDHVTPRLVQGSSKCFGRLEVQFGDTWKTVCGLDWDFKNANVVCAQLHCGVAVSLSSSAHSGGSTVLMGSEVFKCTGNETQLKKCHRSSDTHQDCSGHNNVTLVCSDENWWPRLVNGGSRCDGRVEVYYNGSWGRVQDTLWDLNDSHVVCRQLGCGHALETYKSSQYEESDGRLWLHDIQCHGQESQLRDCRITGPLNSSVTNSSGVVILCSEHIQLRLSDGGSPCAGRVEIYYNGTWGSVCDDSWDMIDAEVVCKQLGCGHVMDMSLPSSYEPGSGPVWLKDVKCSGNESFLWECPSAPFGHQDDCSHKEDVRIMCSEHKLMRLVNGRRPCEGRVDVFYNGTWGTLCSKSLEFQDAEVICKQLRCGSILSIDFYARLFGAGMGPIWLDGIDCPTHESTLWQCQRNPWGQNNCDHSEDAGVLCSGNKTNLLIFHVNCSGRVEIMCDTRWGSVCGDSWDITDANVVCRQLGCGFALSARGRHTVPQGNDVIWQNDVKLISASVDSLNHIEYYTSHGLHDNHPGSENLEVNANSISDRIHGSYDDIETESQDSQSQLDSDRNEPLALANADNGFCSLNRLVDTQANSAETVRLRLANGDSPCAGRVEIHYKGKWGTVYALLWDLPDAAVVCRELDCGTAVSAPGGAHFGKGSGPIVTSDVEYHIIPRLVQGSSQCFGRLEVLFGDTWKTMCGLDWDLKNANVVCAQLHCGVAVSLSSSAHSGGSTVLMGSEVFKCTGNETQLKMCPRSSDTHQDCSGHNNVTLICSDENWWPRLVNGGSRCDGRVEVYYNGSWGRVQDTLWDLNDSHVVCRQLGCGHALETYKSSLYEESDGRLWLHDIQCHGQESQLRDCRITGPLNSSVTNSSGVVILCSEQIQLRLSDGGSPCAGRVEIYYNGTWGSVCDNSWDMIDAEVVCKQLGCGHVMDMSLASSYEPGSGPVWLKDVKCSGNESFLWECPSAPLGHQDDCSHKEDVRMMCSDRQNSVRLDGGRSNCSGRVEIMCDTRWGSVCGDSWDITDANVVCRQLGCGFALSARGRHTVPQGNDVIWQNDVKWLEIPIVVCITLGVMLICEVLVLLVVMQRKLQMKEPHTVGRGSSLGVYQGIYEEIENIPNGKRMDQKHGADIEN
ncbi:deleted in malignant brain tumors 1 protein-like [Hemiscyllium ocellatum]|uniref:deleted in malignant brain tumors 1 protein-like n=1 Tax=Hemiscyllium ocellatum TaxID=170820 RepID=UPI002966C1D4|nr:deleted in malignant brain tumors 1 protein-like [Hemiscyllium ocellatum]